MRVRPVPGKKVGRTPILAEPIEICSATHKYGAGQSRFSGARKKASRHGERSQSMGDDVHNYVFAASFVFAEWPLRGTSNLRARGIILNSTGRRASGSPST